MMPYDLLTFGFFGIIRLLRLARIFALFGREEGTYLLLLKKLSSIIYF